MTQIRVLLIDDHPIVRSGVRALLERVDDIQIVGEAESGVDAVRLIEQLSPDVLLLDMEMPGKSGVEVAREIKEANLPVSILALSAYDDEEYIRNLLIEGAAGYLTKEEAPDAIVEAVRGVANGEKGWLSRRAALRIALGARTTDDSKVSLTAREEQVVDLLQKGWTNSRIAAQLNLSERTVRFHLTNLYDKIGTSSRSEAIHWALTRSSK